MFRKLILNNHYFYFFLLSAFFLSKAAQERILLFQSDITIQESGRLLVTETIKVASQGRQVRHGIFREFPTIYGTWFYRSTVGFDLRNVLRDGIPEPVTLSYMLNGIRMRIGSPDKRLKPGIYTYTIAYETSRQIGFFKEHDELYWNVTGSGSYLPVDKIIARVKLPNSITSNRVGLEAYTGFYGERQSDFISYFDGNQYVFKTTRPFFKFEGLTIVLSWPKGHIKSPTFWQKVGWFFGDNGDLVMLLLCLLLLLIWNSRIYIRIKRRQRGITVIPLFYPPKDMMPGIMRYIYRMGYDAKVLTADIINMAVQGYLRIEYTRFFMSGRYTLKAIKEPTIDNPYYALYKKLFNKKERLALTENNGLTIQAAIEWEKKECLQKAGRFFTFTWSSISILFLINIFYLTFFLFFGNLSYSSEFNVFIIGMLLLNGMGIGCIYFLRHYTVEGQKIKAEIDGFKIFLEVTEKERLKIIGSPPNKTPELYEVYLPYAIALGVEKQWSEQFAPLFNQMRESGNSYVCLWLVGDNITAFHLATLSSHMNSAINSSIPSSISIPGSSSGSGGRGFSGGGGGGGSTGGW